MSCLRISTEYFITLLARCKDIRTRIFDLCCYINNVSFTDREHKQVLVCRKRKREETKRANEERETTEHV